MDVFQVAETVAEVFIEIKHNFATCYNTNDIMYGKTIISLYKLNNPKKIKYHYQIYDESRTLVREHYYATKSTWLTNKIMY